MAFTLDLINQTLALIGERALATSTGSLGGMVRNALTTALYTVVQQTRASVFEQLLSFTATNTDFLVPIGSIPPNAVQFRKLTFRQTAAGALVVIKEQPLEQLPYTPSYSVVGDKIYLSPQFARPITLFAQALVVPSLPSDDTVSPIPDYLAGAVAHTAAAILCISYLDDGNAASLHRNTAQELIAIARLNSGIGKAREFNIGGVSV
jgi:hypothetical protein